MTGRPSGEIMIVEDEALIGFDLADLLQTAGYRVTGPYATADEAMGALDRGRLSLAILDVNLGEGQTSEAVARRLTQDGTPILFVSGYSVAGSEVLRNFPHARKVSKPWDPSELLRTISHFVGSAPQPVLAG